MLCVSLESGTGPLTVFCWSVQRSALESSMEAWGVSVVVGWTDMFDITIRPRHLICGRTWKGSMFGGEPVALLRFWFC